MIVTIDKFGRVLIPKAIRDRLGLEPGSELTLEVRESADAPSIELRTEEIQPQLVREGGLLLYNGKLPEDFDIVEFIRQQREERSRRIMGLD